MPTEFSTRLSLRILIIFWLTVFGMVAVVARADWQVVWSDEFNGAALDTNHWLAEIGPGTNISSSSGELEIYTNSPNNIQVTNGYLRLIGVDIGTGGNHLLTSARLVTEPWSQSDGYVYSNVIPTYVNVNGAVEIRARIPLGTGIWPALWFLPRYYGTNWDQTAYYGDWPNSGEVDLVENNGSGVTYVNSALHYYGGGTYGGSGTLSSSVTNWHTYRWEWFSNSMNMIYDGVTNFTTSSWSPPPGYSYPAPFDANSGGFFILMNLALGGTYTGSPSAATIAANLPAEMDIDYMRVYTLATANTTTNYTLTVINGTGSGTYTNGEVVNISTNAPGFAHWSANQNIANTNLASTTYTMGPSNDTVTAYYVTPVNQVLSAIETNGNFIVSWVQQPSAWVLEQTTALSLSNTWTQVPVSQYQTNQNQIFFAAPQSLTNNVFYRLVQQ